jgi:2-oxoglutarate dehydrogenase E1 component
MTAPHNQTPQGFIPEAVNAWSPEFLEQEYARFKQDPASVPPNLAAFFQGFDLALAGTPAGSIAGAQSPFQSSVSDLVNAYREFGHQAARLDPLGVPRERPRILTLENHGLTEADLDRVVSTDALPGRTTATLREVIDHLERTYAGSIGAEFMHLPVEEERAWFLHQLEHGRGPAVLSDDERRLILAELTKAEAFDRFLGKRYQGKKRFGAEGAETMIPLLQAMFRHAGSLGVEDLVMGMAHRGRQTVLWVCLRKDLRQIFSEFEDSWADGETFTGGDVKYHGGYSTEYPLPDGRTMHLSMLNNPSHLEAVDPVVMGRCRARQDRLGDTERRRAISLLIHGDAAVAGQGVVAECLTMSQLEGYTVGGTLHLVVNNQLGFTTNPSEGRSSPYCTDIAKSIGAPVLHVNADDPEAAVFAARLAVEYRHRFRKDVFIDLVCFRRHGHNEQDEPTFTQPTMYARVRAHPGTPVKYRQRLVTDGLISEADAQAMLEAELSLLDEGQAAAKASPVDPTPPPGAGEWKGLHACYSLDSPRTGVDAATLEEVCAALGRVPDSFHVHPRLKALLKARADLPRHGRISYADGEHLAYATLLLDGTPVRLSGQDVRRGTFTHRHAYLFDAESGDPYVPMNFIRPGRQALFSAWNSPLSEYAVMGFEYGYSCGAPRTLVLWEAQFGDFCNGAQIIIDQFISSSELKWSRWTGLVLLLPHGCEGMGPEHSSARLERFLQLCAGENMEVVSPTTGSQIFHLLRRQALRDFRKPLIIMAPKRHLRLETSSFSELTTGCFRHLLDDPDTQASDTRRIRRVIYCTGKIYHELAEKRAALGCDSIAIVRIEQLYPFHTTMAREIDARYPAQAQRVWVQEEPRNNGAFPYISEVFREQLGISLTYIGRPPSASPATGSEHVHLEQQDRLLTEALTLPSSERSVNGTSIDTRGQERPVETVKSKR